MMEDGDDVAMMQASREANGTAEANVISAASDVLVAYLVIGLFGLLSNVFVIVVIVVYRPMRERVTNLYIINQCLIDATVAFFLFTTTLAQDSKKPLTRGRWKDELICRLWYTKMPLWGLLMSSTYSLIALTFDRYLAVVHPLWHRTSGTHRQALITMLVCWLIGPTYNVAYMAPSAAVLSTGQCTVYSEWPDTRTQSAVGVLTVFLQFILPLVLLLYGYIRMALVLHRLAVDTAHRSTGLELRNENVIRARTNVVKTLATVALFFIVCWISNQTYYVMYYCGYEHVDFTSSFYNFTVIMVFLNCCVNPVIYALRYDQFQRGVMWIFCRRRLNGVSEIGPTPPNTLSSDERQNCRAVFYHHRSVADIT